MHIGYEHPHNAQSRRNLAFKFRVSNISTTCELLALPSCQYDGRSEDISGTFASKISGPLDSSALGPVDLTPPAQDPG
ncbi:hypothetical protein OY671_002693 [Metschnikowia pulcherrima]|nr:hypothetical protein OY671_002693 [Metschnikowia pulcherrima]